MHETRTNRPPNPRSSLLRLRAAAGLATEAELAVLAGQWLVLGEGGLAVPQPCATVEAWLAKHGGPVLPEPVHVPATPPSDAVYAPREPVADLALGVVLADPAQPEPAPAGKPKYRGRRLSRGR